MLHAVQTTHLDFQEPRAGYYQGVLQPTAGAYLNTSALASDPGAQVVLLLLLLLLLLLHQCRLLQAKAVTVSCCCCLTSLSPVTEPAKDCPAGLLQLLALASKGCC